MKSGSAIILALGTGALTFSAIGSASVLQKRGVASVAYYGENNPHCKGDGHAQNINFNNDCIVFGDVTDDRVGINWGKFSGQPNNGRAAGLAIYSDSNCKDRIDWIDSGSSKDDGHRGSADRCILQSNYLGVSKGPKKPWGSVKFAEARPANLKLGDYTNPQTIRTTKYALQSTTVNGPKSTSKPRTGYEGHPIFAPTTSVSQSTTSESRTTHKQSYHPTSTTTHKYSSTPVKTSTTHKPSATSGTSTPPNPAAKPAAKPVNIPRLPKNGWISVFDRNDAICKGSSRDILNENWGCVSLGGSEAKTYGINWGLTSVVVDSVSVYSDHACQELWEELEGVKKTKRGLEGEHTCIAQSTFGAQYNRAWGSVKFHRKPAKVVTRSDLESLNLASNSSWVDSN